MYLIKSSQLFDLPWLVLTTWPVMLWVLLIVFTSQGNSRGQDEKRWSMCYWFRFVSFSSRRSWSGMHVLKCYSQWDQILGENNFLLQGLVVRLWDIFLIDLEGKFSFLCYYYWHHDFNLHPHCCHIYHLPTMLPSSHSQNLIKYLKTLYISRLVVPFSKL